MRDWANVTPFTFFNNCHRADGLKLPFLKKNTLVLWILRSAVQVRDGETFPIWRYAPTRSPDHFLRMNRSYQVVPGCEVLGPERNAGYMVYLEHGKAAVLYNDPHGFQMLLRYVYSGDLVGEMGMLGHTEESNVSVVARQSCIVRRISYLDFRRQALLEPALLSMLTAQLTDRLKSTTRRLVELSSMDVSMRIASCLYELCKAPEAKTHPHGHQVSITRQDLSLMVGCSRESAGRAIKVLQKSGFLQAKGQTMIVFSAEAPKQMALPL